jgi:AcrR family transcriptional regulator
MATRSASGTRRAPLSRPQILGAAVQLADDAGIGAVTMRGLAQRLGIEAMSLYHHVADKNELLDGMVELLVGEINDRVVHVLPDGADWKPVVRGRILTARQVLLAHPWSPAVIESREGFNVAVVRYFESLAGLLREGGLSVRLVHRAMHALGSRALGFSQELFAPGAGAGATEDENPMPPGAAEAFPYLTEIVTQEIHDHGSMLGWCDDQVEFEFGLDLILDGLERLAGAPASG